jgi:hypothetical protein
MKEEFDPALIKLPDKFVTEQHSGMSVHNIEAGGQNEHRSELDWYVQVEPIERPDFFC